jgi:hypothetical protein
LSDAISLVYPVFDPTRLEDSQAAKATADLTAEHLFAVKRRIHMRSDMIRFPIDDNLHDSAAV